MAHGAGLGHSSSPQPTSMLIILVVAILAAACLRTASAAPHGGDGPRPITSRFLAYVARGKKGDPCRAGDPGACSGAGDGEAAGERLKCCGRACADVLASRSNCGACGARCPFGQLCCGGRCTAVAYDADNCGACRRACPAGLRCTYGMCGYA